MLSTEPDHHHTTSALEVNYFALYKFMFYSLAVANMNNKVIIKKRFHAINNNIELG